MAVVSGDVGPIHCQGRIGWNAVVIAAANGELELGGGIAIFREFLEIFHGWGWFFRNGDGGCPCVDQE